LTTQESLVPAREVPVEVVRRVLETNLGLQPKERLVIVTDIPTEQIGHAFFDAGIEAGAVAVLVVIPPTGRNGAEPPPAAAGAMLGADVVVCPTLFSLSHTSARHQATLSGARVATLPGIHAEMFFDGPIAADHVQVERRTLRLQELLTAAETATIISGDGSRLTFSLAGRDGRASTGRLLTRGAFGNLPSGEAYIAPVEGTASGELVVNASVAGIGLVPAPFKLRVEQGLLSEAEGETGARLLELLGDAPQARNVAEFGIGTNEKARITGVILEDEKAIGTIHIAFGDNSTFGGVIRAGVHLDTVILAPTVLLDGTPVLDSGRLLI
jgi:leucyl aminopeptidase (aminopeptidase T)